MSTVVLEDLTKYYGSIKAVEDIKLTIQGKEFFTLLGPSGCGKTTLLRLVAGLERPTKGNIYIDGRSVLDAPVQERDVAMVFQTWALYTHMTVHDNLAFPLKMRKHPKQKIESEVKRVAEMLQLTNILDRKPGALAGGEQQRVALGRALIREPKVFLMDEPLSNIDPKLRFQMRVDIRALQKRLGVTTIYVTHDQVEAMTMSDRITLLNFGAVQQVGTPSDVYSKPVNIFVGGFIGSPPMNTFRCSLTREDGRAFLDAGVFKLDATDIEEVIERSGSPDELVLGIRPEDISVSPKQLQGAFKAKVFMIEPLGSEAIIDIQFGDDLVRAKVPADVSVNVDDEVWIDFDRRKIHVFDKSGKAIL